MTRIRNPDSAPGDWYIDNECIDCGAACHVAPGLIVERNGKSVFVRQPKTPEDRLAAWRAVLVCPTASVRSETKQPRPEARVFPEAITDAVWRCGFNARSSFGAHSYFVTRPSGNILIDSPRYARELVTYFANAGGIAHILLSHQDDVADASKFAERFGARVWIHHDDRYAAPYASDLIEGASERAIVPDLVAFRDACWYSWSALTASLAKLAGYRFEWVLPGHGWPAHCEAGEMQARLQALVARMRKS